MSEYKWEWRGDCYLLVLAVPSGIRGLHSCRFNPTNSPGMTQYYWAFTSAEVLAGDWAAQASGSSLLAGEGATPTPSTAGAEPHDVETHSPSSADEGHIEVIMVTGSVENMATSNDRILNWTVWDAEVAKLQRRFTCPCQTHSHWLATQQTSALLSQLKFVGYMTEPLDRLNSLLAKIDVQLHTIE